MRCFTYIFVFLFISIGAFSQNAIVEAELKQADRNSRNGNYSEAIKHINNALEEDPLYLPALERKINVLIQSEDDKGALKEVNELLKDFPQQPEYYYLRSIIYLYKQKGGKAIDDLNNAIYYQMPKENLDKIYVSRGTAYYFIGDFESAEADFQEAVTLNPKNASAYHSWGMLKYEEQLFDEAIANFNKAILYEDNSAITHYNIAMAYYKQDEMKDACHHFNRSCVLGNRSACKIYYLECSE